MGRLRGRPIPAVHRPVKMLRAQPALPTFAAMAKSEWGRTYKSRDEAALELTIPNVHFFHVLGT